MAVFNPYAPIPKCSKCGTSHSHGLISYERLCKDCFREQQENKSIEERLLDLEIGLYYAQQHQHIENMRF